MGLLASYSDGPEIELKGLNLRLTVTPLCLVILV